MEIDKSVDRYRNFQGGGQITTIQNYASGNQFNEMLIDEQNP